MDDNNGSAVVRHTWYSNATCIAVLGLLSTLLTLWLQSGQVPTGYTDTVKTSLQGIEAAQKALEQGQTRIEAKPAAHVVVVPAPAVTPAAVGPVTKEQADEAVRVYTKWLEQQKGK